MSKTDSFGEFRGITVIIASSLHGLEGTVAYKVMLARAVSQAAAPVFGQRQAGTHHRKAAVSQRPDWVEMRHSMSELVRANGCADTFHNLPYLVFQIACGEIAGGYNPPYLGF